MRFWQAVVVAQLAAGSVYADRYSGDSAEHFLAEFASVAFGAAVWFVLKQCFDRPQCRSGGGR